MKPAFDLQSAGQSANTLNECLLFVRYYVGIGNVELNKIHQILAIKDNWCGRQWNQVLWGGMWITYVKHAHHLSLKKCKLKQQKDYHLKGIHLGREALTLFWAYSKHSLWEDKWCASMAYRASEILVGISRKKSVVFRALGIYLDMSFWGYRRGSKCYHVTALGIVRVLKLSHTWDSEGRDLLIRVHFRSNRNQLQ